MPNRRPCILQGPARGPIAVALAMVVCSCTGQIGESTTPGANGQSSGDPNDPNPGHPSNPGVPGNPGNPGDPGAPIVQIEPHVRRLTSTQFRNTLTTVFGPIFTPEQFPDFGDDIPTLGLSNGAALLRVNAINVENIYASVEQLALQVVESDATVSGCVAAGDDGCFALLVDTFAPRLWRRPLAADERADLLAARTEVAQGSGTRAEQAELLMQALLLSPNMLYRTEIGADGEDLRRLTAYELAAALSYTLWNAPPDAALMAVAADGTLAQPEVLTAQARRMANDDRLAEAFAEFFVDYLKLAAIYRKEKAPEFGLTPEVRAAMETSARADLVAAFAQEGATLMTPFELEAFRVNNLTAPFFGVSQGSVEFVTTPMVPNERRGIITHPVFLSVHAGEGNSGIIKRGVFILEQLLCVPLGAPPAAIGSNGELPPGFDPDTASTRQLLEIRHSAQAECNGCHRYIDPAGFGLENFDGVGRYRTTERGSVPIDASGTLEVNGETLTFTDSLDYIDTLMGSQSLSRCLSESFLTYVLGSAPGRAEVDAFHAGVIQAGGDIRRVAELAVTTPSFTARMPETN